MTVLPSARAPATAIIGISSMIFGTISPSISMPFNPTPSIETFPISSPLPLVSIDSETLAPILVRIFNIPFLEGFRPTFLTVSFDPLNAAADTNQNAALEISPGTIISRDSRTCPPSILISSLERIVFTWKKSNIFSV